MIKYTAQRGPDGFAVKIRVPGRAGGVTRFLTMAPATAKRSGNSGQRRASKHALYQ